MIEVKANKDVKGPDVVPKRGARCHLSISDQPADCATKLALLQLVTLIFEKVPCIVERLVRKLNSIVIQLVSVRFGQNISHAARVLATLCQVVAGFHT